jgi:hypothetical protein
MLSTLVHLCLDLSLRTASKFKPDESNSMESIVRLFRQETFIPKVNITYHHSSPTSYDDKCDERSD